MTIALKKRMPAASSALAALKDAVIADINAGTVPTTDSINTIIAKAKKEAIEDYKADVQRMFTAEVNKRRAAADKKNAAKKKAGASHG